MIYRDYITFARVCEEECKSQIPVPESHRSTATFSFGDARKGFHLLVDNQGWRLTLEGVETSRRVHIASPLANLQAAVCYLLRDHG